MGAKSFLLTFDIAKCTQIQGGILIPFAAGVITGSSSCSDTERVICVEGDEKNILFSPCGYTTPAFPVPGVIMCEITELDSSHYSKFSMDDGKKILLTSSSSFKTKCTVTAPASNPATLSFDVPGKAYSGTGNFSETGPHNCEEN